MAKKKEKTFNVKKCPKCGSDQVNVVVGKEKSKKWECKKCKWKGTDVIEEEMTEQEFMKYLDERGEEVA